MSIIRRDYWPGDENILKFELIDSIVIFALNKCFLILEY